MRIAQHQTSDPSERETLMGQHARFDPALRAPGDGWAAPAVTPVGLTGRHRVDVTGPNALGLLQQLTTSDLDRPVGTRTRTLCLDRAGAIRADLDVVRLGAEHFVVGAATRLELRWLGEHALGDVTVTEARLLVDDGFGGDGLDGDDLGPATAPTPAEAGLGHLVDLAKGPFLGRDAVLADRRRRPLAAAGGPVSAVALR